MVATLSTRRLNRSWLVVVPSFPIVLPSCLVVREGSRPMSARDPIERKETGLE